MVTHRPSACAVAFASTLALLGCGGRSSLDDAIYAHAPPDAAPHGRDAARPGPDSASAGHDAAPPGVDSAPPPGRDAAPDAVSDATDGGPACPGASGSVPVALVSGLDSPDGIAVDDTTVYWTESATGTVKSVSICGGAVTTIASGLSAPYSIALDATSVYWIDFPDAAPDGTLMKIAKRGAAAPEILAAGLGGVSNFSVGSSAVYAATGIGPVTAIPLEGGPPTVVVPGNVLVSGIAADATRVCWLSELGGAFAGILFSDPLAPGGAQLTLASGLDNARGLVVVAGSPYWVESATAMATVSNLVRVPAAGGTPEVVASNVGEFAIDGAEVFWIGASSTPGTGDILGAPIDGGAPSVLATGEPFPTGIAVNASGVYWSQGSSATGAILKVAR